MINKYPNSTSVAVTIENYALQTALRLAAVFSLVFLLALRSMASGFVPGYTGDKEKPYACTITLTSAPGTNAQTVCNNTAITSITYATTDATGATFSGLPGGVTGSWAADVVTISGTPTAAGTYNYTVTLTGAGCAGVTATGTIIVNPVVSGVITGTGSGNICAGQNGSINMNLSGKPVLSGVLAITVINGSGTSTPAFNFTSVTSGVTAINIPAANLTNTSSNTVVYQVTWVSLADADGCNAVSRTGSANITVYPVPSINVTGPAAAPDICPGTDIIFNVTNPNTVFGALYNLEVKDALNNVLVNLPNQSWGNSVPFNNASCNLNNPLTFTFTPLGPSPLGCMGTPVVRQVNVRDLLAPSLNGTLPGGNLGNTCLAAVPPAPTTTAIRNLYTDNCTAQANLVVTQGATITTGNNCGWTVTYPFTVTDGCGNTTAANVIYTGADTQVPVWTNAAGTLNTTIQCGNDAAAFAAQLAAAQALVPTATDNCADGATLSANTVKTAGSFAQGSPGTCITAGTYTNSFVTDDGCGNLSVAFLQVITIVDNTPPTLSSPGPQNLNVGGVGCSAIIPDYRPLVTATDCTPVTMTQFPAPGATAFGTGGSIEVTITATDGCGNVSTRDITINFVDVTPPDARCHDITVNLSAAGTATVTPAQIDGNGAGPTFNPKSSDNCALNTFNGGLTFLGPNVAPNTNILRNYTCANLGANIETLVVTDVAGNTSTCSATITVVDVTAPVVNCPPNQTVAKGANCSNLMPNFVPLAGATDACGPVTITQSPAPGSIFGAGSSAVPVTMTATDGSGNSSTCVFTVNFVDLTPPVLTACPANITVNIGAGNTDCSIAVNWTPPTATDNCDPGMGAVVVSSTHTPGQLFTGGVTTVTYTATDPAGNTSTCSFTVTVTETTPPVITCASPGPKVVGTNPGVCTWTKTGTDWDANGTDNCMPLVPGTYVLSGATTGNGSSLNGVVFNKGVTTVTWTVTDLSGNSATCSFTVTVNDTQAPSITCPATVNINSNTAGCAAIVPGTSTQPTVSDNCAVTLLEWSVSGATPVSSGTGNIGTYTFSLGTSLVTYRVSDAAGNSTVCSFNVVVSSGVTGSISGTATVPQHPSNTSPITLTGNGGAAPYTFTFSLNGGPVQTISTSGVNNSVTINQSASTTGVYAYTLLSVSADGGCTGTVNAPATATVTVTGGTADLSNSQFFTTTQIQAGGVIDEVIVVRNVGTQATSGPIVFNVTNYSPITGLSVTSNTNPSVTIGFTTYTLDNANWTVSSAGGSVTFTSNAGVVINPGQSRFLGVRINRAAGANGTVTHSSTVIPGTGGGETPTGNNSISNTILKN